MKDPLESKRIKSRFIVEVRYEPFTDILDKKGEIINKIHPEIKVELPHWNVQQSNIVFLDNKDRATRDFVIDLHRTAIAFEDYVNIVKFKNYLNKTLWPLYSNFFGNVKVAKRVGVRIISVMRPKDGVTFEEAKNNIKERFLVQKLPFFKEMADLRVQITHKDGFYQIGPVKPDEQWLRGMFSIPEIESDGYGFDIDSSSIDTPIGNLGSFKSAVNALLDMSVGIEQQLAQYLGIVQ